MLRLASGLRCLSVNTLSRSSSLAKVVPPRPLCFSASQTLIHTTAWHADKGTGAESTKTTRKLVGGAKKATNAAPKKTATKKAVVPKKVAPKKNAAVPLRKLAPKKAAPKKTAVPKKKAAPKKVVKQKAPPKPKRILNPPKRMNSSWVLYFKERLAALPAEERKDVASLTKQYIPEYRALSSSARAALDQRLQEHKADYEVQLKEYMDSITPEMIAAENAYRRSQKKISKKKRLPKLLRDPSKPQVPLNGYMRFCQEVRGNRSLSEKYLNEPDHTKVPVGTAAKALSVGWKNLSDQEKEPYHAAYEKDKAVYLEQVSEWKAQQPAL